MERFHVIDEAAIILKAKGVFRQVKAYRRGRGLYAGHAGGFIRLHKDGGTSLPNVMWDGSDVPSITFDKLGRAEVSE